MDALSRYADRFTSRRNVVPGAEYDGSDAGRGAEEAADPSRGIEERAFREDFRHPVALLPVSDMRKFRAAAEERGGLFAVGGNYAVVPVGDGRTGALSPSGPAFLGCDPDFPPSSGHRTERALADGCVPSDHFPS